MIDHRRLFVDDVDGATCTAPAVPAQQQLEQLVAAKYRHENMYTPRATEQ